jgi:hypothetical protein
MILSTTFSISSVDGQIKYDSHVSGQDIPMNEASKLHLDALTKVHKAIEEAVNNINGSLVKEGIARKMVIPEQ